MMESQKRAVFVPVSTSMPIASGSAIVGAESSEAEITIDYEGNIYGSANIKTFADRARHAADRQYRLYPTVARAIVPRSMLYQVGWYDPNDGIILLDDPQARDALASWLGMEDLDARELLFSDL